MTGAEWKYYIMEEDGRTGRIVNGVVSFLSSPKPLPNNPDGWQDVLIAWERSMTRYGNMRNFSFPLGFVLDGAKILRDGLYKSNVDRKLYLLIQRRVTELDDTYFRDYYKYFYKGQFDFTTAEDKQGQSRFEVNLMEGGKWKLLKAKEDTVYSIPFDADAVRVKMDGVELDGVYNWIIGERTEGSGTTWPVMVISSQEQKAPGIAVFDVTSGEEIADLADNLNYFMAVNEAPVDGTIRVSGSIKMYNPDPLQIRFLQLFKYNVNTGVTSPFISLYTGPEAEVITFDEDVPVVPGDRLFLAFNAYYTEGDFKVQLKSKRPTTYIPAFTAYTLFRKLVENITGNADDAASVILKTSPYVVTSGDGVRGLAGASVKTSLKQFFTAFNVYHMLGMGVENNKITIEARQHFFQYGTPIDCGNTKDLVITPAVDLMFSRLKIGHTEQNIQDVNGKYDFNGIYHYSSPIESVSNELDLVSPYKAGPFEIEITRINFEGLTTTDSSNDNSVYVIDAVAQPTTFTGTVRFITDNIFPYQLDNLDTDLEFTTGQTITTTSTQNPGPFTIGRVFNFLGAQVLELLEPVVNETVSTTITVTSGAMYNLRREIIPTAGVPSPETVFNVSLYPPFLLRIHGAWLRGVLEGYPGKSLEFNSTNLNKDLVADGIAAADVPVLSLAAPMLSPWYFEYATQVPISLVDELETDQNRSFSGTNEGRNFEGFGISTGLAPNTREEQTFKILLVPGQDIKNFIT